MRYARTTFWDDVKHEMKVFVRPDKIHISERNGYAMQRSSTRQMVVKMI